MGHWIEVRAFEDADVAAAAELLTERHERHRAAEPLLAPAGDAAALVARAWRKEGTSGAVAVGEGEVDGFLLGTVAENEWWNRHVWIGLAGHAAREPELVRDLYRVAAERWVEEGAELHVALVPALHELTEPWFRLAFAHMQAHGIRESGRAAGALPGDVAVRPGTIADLRATPALVTQIWEHHTRAPTFTGLTVPPVEEFLSDWEETLGAADRGYFVAELDGRLVGHLLLDPEEPDLATAAGLGLPRRGRHAAGGARQRRGRGAHGARPRMGPRGRIRDRADRLAHGQPRVVPLLAAPRLPGDVLPAGPARRTSAEPWADRHTLGTIRAPQVRFLGVRLESGWWAGVPQEEALLAVGPGERGRHAEADEHRPRDPALGPEEAPVPAQPVRRRAGGERVDPVADDGDEDEDRRRASRSGARPSPCPRRRTAAGTRRRRAPSSG